LVHKSYHELTETTNSDNGLLSRVEGLFQRLEDGSADPGYVALQLAKYTAQLPDLAPTVRDLAETLDPHTRTLVCQKLSAACPSPASPAPAASPSPVDPASARQEAARLWHEIGDPRTALLLMARLVVHDPSLAADIRALAGLTLVYECDRRQVLDVLAKHLPPDTSTADPPLVEQLELVGPAVGGLRVDPEIGRMAIALNLAAQHRIWALMRHHGGAQSWIWRDDLEAQLAGIGITYNPRYLRRLLRQGNGLFWGMACRGRKIFYRSAAHVGAMLVRLAKREGRPELYETNLPGGRDVWVLVPVDLGEWEARIYAAWMTWRGGPEIARDTLAILFGRCPDTFRQWEKRLGGWLKVRMNIAQSTCQDPAQLPPYASQYLTWNNVRRFRWQLPNTYLSAFRLHKHKGSARKRREQAGYAAFGQPVDDDKAQSRSGNPRAGWWFDRSHRSQRRYHGRPDKLMSIVRRDARSKYPSGIRRQVHYVWRGQNRLGRGVFEYVPREEPYDEIAPDWVPRTTADERIPIKMEYAVMGDYKRHERAYLRFLQAQGELG